MKRRSQPSRGALRAAAFVLRLLAALVAAGARGARALLAARRAWSGAVLVAALVAADAHAGSFDKSGWLTVRTKAPADISIDGRRVGQSPIYMRPVEPGAHVVVASCSGCMTQRKKVNVRSGQKVVIDIEVVEAGRPGVALGGFGLLVGALPAPFPMPLPKCL